MGIWRLDELPSPSTCARACSAHFLAKEGSSSLGCPGEDGLLELGICWCFLLWQEGQRLGALTDSPGTRPPGPCGSLGRDRAGGT